MIDGMIAKAREYQAHKVDFHVNSKDVSFDLADTKMIVVGTFPSKLDLTDYARNQLYAKMEPTIFNIPADPDEQRRGRKSWKEYMDAHRTAEPVMYSMCMSRWMEMMDSKLFIRAYDDKCRAVLSNRFAAVDTLECLEWTKQALSSNEARAYKFHNCLVTPDFLRMSITMSDVTINDGGHNRGGGGTYGVGCDIGTGEIGNARIWCNPYVQRTSCTNSIAYPKSDYSFSHRHVGIRENLSRTFVVSVFNALRGCEEILRRLTASLEEPLPNIDELIAGMCKENGWSQETGYAIAVGTEGESNLWGLVQGVSYAANSVTDPERQLEMHNFAGALLMNGREDLREL